MNRSERTEWVAVKMAQLLAFGLAAAVCVGCSPDKVKDAMPTLFPKTPRQAALGAFNVYDADVRCASIKELAAAPFGGEAAYLRTYRLLIDDPDPTVRAACAHALGLHGGVEDATRLALCLYDPVAFVRWEGAKALQKIHAPLAVKPLMEAMAEDSDPDVRMSAAVALGQYPERQVFDALVGALEDPHHSVIVGVRRSLKTLTGYDFGSDGGMWITWSEQVGAKLFEHQETYTWQSYEKPTGIIDKVKFWKKKPEPALPRVPAGLEDDAT